MRIILDGKATDGLTDRQIKDLRTVRVEGPLQGTVLSRTEATKAYVQRTKRIFSMVGLIALIGLAGLPFAADERDRWLIVPVAVGCGGALVAFIYVFLGHRIKVWNRASERRASGLPPAGSVISLDASRLKVGDETFDWSNLGIELVEIRSFDRGPEASGRLNLIERLSLEAGPQAVVLDAAMISNGQRVVDNAWLRLHKKNA
jgi:hypothetical protein